MTFARIRLLSFLAGFLLLVPATRADEEKPKVIEDGTTVGIEYSLTLDDGTLVDSNVGKEPLVYQQGKHQILPALEKALAGLMVNQEKEVTLSPEEGYGPVNPHAFREVPVDQIPEGARHAGAMLVSRDPEGHQYPVRVHEIHGDRVVLDFNHPLAGKTLHFKIKVLSIQ